MKVAGTTKILGVFGHPVSHSLSPVMHNAALRALGLNYVYVPFHVLPEDLEDSLRGVRALGIAGVNITIPHKERIIPFLDEVSENARRVGAVNTVVNDRGRLYGDTTDGPGFLRSVESEWGPVGGSKAVILGAGGSAKAVAFALRDAGCEVVISNRTPERASQLVDALNAQFGGAAARAVGMSTDVLESEIGQAGLLVNTTSVGMHPDEGCTPVPVELLHPGVRVYDLVYNPRTTRLVAEARARGAKAMTGLSMLVHQGAISFEMWTGVAAPVDVMSAALESCGC